MQHAEDAHEAHGRAGDRRDAFAEIALANRENYTLYEIAKAMGRSLSLSETMTLISSRISSLVPFSSCVLFVRDGNMLRCRFASGPRTPSCSRARSMKEGIGLSGWVVRHGQAARQRRADLEFARRGRWQPSRRARSPRWSAR